jgi:glycosyltransferase involved in cell wall biosynthesis
MTAPLASCLMPTKNRRPFVARAIRLFQRQTYDNRELVILDDGDDGVGDLIPDDPRVRYIRAPRFSSLGAKRNAACEAARGDILLHWDDDDWYAPARIETQVAALLASGADLCGIDRVYFLDPDKAEGWEYVYPPAGPPWLCGAALCFRREFWRANPFPALDIGEDTAFAGAAPRARMHVMPDKSIFVGLIHEGNTSPRRTQDALWRRAPLEDIRNAMGADWPLGAEAAAPEPARVNVVIPHGGEERLPHLAACLARLGEARGIDGVIVVEMGRLPVAGEFARRFGANHVFIRHDGPFERARALNVGAAVAPSDLALWLDNDLLIPPDFVVRAAEELRRRELDYLIPYSRIDYLSEYDSEKLRAGGADPRQCRPVRSLTPGDMVSGGAGLVRLAFLRRHGGIPEGFRGWGGEDNAWTHKASLFGHSAVSADPAQRLWHLFHASSGAHDASVHRKNPHYAQNLALLQQLSAVRNPKEYSARFPPQPQSCPWDRAKIIVFVAGANRARAECAASGLKSLLGLDIVLAPADGALARTLRTQNPDAAVAFDMADEVAAAIGPAKTCPAPSAPADALGLASALAGHLSLLLNRERPAEADDELCVWTYWEGERPGWIDACRATLTAHAPRIRQLDRAAFERLRNTDRDIDIDRLQVAHRADFIRAWLLAHHGGVWIDSDCIAMKPLGPLLDLLRDHDFIAHRDRQGYFPNGFIGARKGSLIAGAFYNKLCDLLRSGQPLGWISLGGEPLTALLTTTKTPYHELPCDWIQPICWSRPEVFFAVADTAAHERALNRDAFCYMLSNTEIRKYRDRFPGRALSAAGTFFEFLLQRSAQSREQADRQDSAMQAIFERRYRENLKAGDETVCGPGSTLSQTGRLRRELPGLLRELGIGSVIDAPCGDFNWMRHVDLSVNSYLGVDIVGALVERNLALCANARRSFRQADLTSDILPHADLIFCRDALVHMSFDGIRRALKNFVASGATFLLTTNFGPHRRNAEIVTGDWRPLNFEAPPFDFPAPIRRLIEDCTEMGGIYADKSLSLWRLGDLAATPFLRAARE